MPLEVRRPVTALCAVGLLSERKRAAVSGEGAGQRCASEARPLEPSRRGRGRDQETGYQDSGGRGTDAGTDGGGVAAMIDRAGAGRPTSRRVTGAQKGKTGVPGKKAPINHPANADAFGGWCMGALFLVETCPIA